jgi:hypothetical protein
MAIQPAARNHRCRLTQASPHFDHSGQMDEGMSIVSTQGVSLREAAGLPGWVGAAFLAVSCLAGAATADETRGDTTSSNALQIHIESTRSQPAMGTGLGIIAELKNTSNAPVYLLENRVNLVIPPEIQSAFAGVANWWATFPTQHSPGLQYKQDGTLEPLNPNLLDADGKPIAVAEKFRGRLTLMPGATYRVFWSLGPSMPSASGTFDFVVTNLTVIRSELNFLLFTPGEYKFSVVAQYWTDPETPDAKYFTVTASEKVRVTAPQSVILVGSALGGLIAYLLLPRLRHHRPSPKTMPSVRRDTWYWRSSEVLLRLARTIAGVLGAMLLSAIVTILLARISETQFLIRVNISDFWGAIAIGFLANLGGVKIFSKFAPPGLIDGDEPKPPLISHDRQLDQGDKQP